jgi:hypothetical protein
MKSAKRSFALFQVLFHPFLFPTTTTLGRKGVDSTVDRTRVYHGKLFKYVGEYKSLIFQYKY